MADSESAPPENLIKQVPATPIAPAPKPTPRSRQIIGRRLTTPISRRFKGNGDFEGVVREVDLDAPRFEIRGRGASSGMLSIY